MGCHLWWYSGDQGNGRVSRIDVASVVVACVEGHSTPNVSFEVYNNKNKYAPEEDLKKLYSLEPDEPREDDAQVTGMLLPWYPFVTQDGESTFKVSGSCIAKLVLNGQDLICKVTEDKGEDTNVFCQSSCASLFCQCWIIVN